MLWQPVVIKHPEDLRHGRELWNSVDEAADICACGHSAAQHSRISIVVPMFIEGDYIGEAEVQFKWFACRDLTHHDGYFCMCNGFWKKS